MTDLAIPQPAQFDVGRFEATLPSLLAAVELVADVGQADDLRARAAALEEYLDKRDKAHAGPARALNRHLEARIGALLGPPQRGGVFHLPRGANDLDEHERYEFRLLDKYRRLWAADPGRPRAQLLLDIDRHRAARRAGRRQIEAEARMVVATGAGDRHGQGWALLNGEAGKRSNDVGTGSVGLIVTDPPYATQDLDLWEELALAAVELLRPQGILVALTGQILLPDVMLILGSQLDWGWCYCQPLPGASSRIVGRHIGQEWKPWLAFSNGAWPSGRVGWHPDMLNGVPLAKTRHRWEQSTGPALQLIEALCPPGGVVLDPFCGTGTYGVAALSAGRMFVGIEPDGERLALAAERLQAVRL
jgi:16S rRNA G966 N2-methylase RsmD